MNIIYVQTADINLSLSNAEEVKHGITQQLFSYVISVFINTYHYTV